MPPSLTIWDNILAAALVVALPIAAIHSRRHMERERAAGRPVARPLLYWRTMLSQWLGAAGVVGVWLGLGRPWTDLGLGGSLGWGFWVGAALTAAAVAVLVRQVVRARRDEKFAAQTVDAAKSVEFLLPTSEAEYRVFAAVGVTAGIVEELLFRGFLVWYLAAFMPLGAAVVVSAVSFGLGHLYQGAREAVQTGALSLLMGGLYLLSGSIWLAMVLHAAVDVLQVRMILDARVLDPRAAEARVAQAGA